MKKKYRAITRVAYALLCLLILSAPVYALAPGVAYLSYEHWGGTWYDTEKSPLTPEDDLLCWAATCANTLVWTGWAQASGMASTDQIFLYYRNHWTNVGGMMEYGWNWWFSGVNPSQGLWGWSQVDVPGGGFYPTRDMYDYFHEQWTGSLVMESIDSFLRSGYGVGLALYGGGGHAVTCWGYNYDPGNSSTYYGVWITDSDDDRFSTSPPDRLVYYNVAFNSTTERWYLQDFYGTSNVWYIGGVQGLEGMPGEIPEPSALAGLVLGVAVLISAARRRRS